MSHHFDSPTAIEDGRLNLCDVYVFPGPPGTTTLVLTVNPDSGRSTPATFRADALYEFVIAGDGGTVEDRAFRMSFGEPDADDRQEMRVRYAAGVPSRSGLEGAELGAGRIGEAFALDNGGSAWFGPAGDPFWGDGVSLFAFHQGLAENQYRPELFTASPGNLLAGRNVTAIALQVPDATLGGTDVAVWARISLYGPHGQSDVAAVVLPATRHGHRGAQRRFAGRRCHPVRRGRAADRGARGEAASCHPPRRARCHAGRCVPARRAALPARPAGVLRARHGQRPRPARRRVRHRAIAAGRRPARRHHLTPPGNPRIDAPPCLRENQAP